MKILKCSFFVFFIYQMSSGQNKETIPKGFNKLEGLEYMGHITFYFGKKTQTILAFQNEKVKWEATVMKTCGKPSVGKSKIREIRIEKKHLKIVYGKHSFAKIVMETGEIICEESD